jgi:hypothetical protein
MKIKSAFVSLLTATGIAVGCIAALGITTNAVAHEDKNWKTFISPEYKFSIDYPSDLEAYNHLSGSKIPSVFFFNFRLGQPQNHQACIFTKMIWVCKNLLTVI